MYSTQYCNDIYFKGISIYFTYKIDAGQSATETDPEIDPSVELVDYSSDSADDDILDLVVEAYADEICDLILQEHGDAI